MSQKEQGKQTGQVISDAAVKEVMPAKPDKRTGLLSDKDLDKVAGGLLQIKQLVNISDGAEARKVKDVIKLNCVNEKLN